MTFLTNISQGPTDKGQRFVISAVEKTGKTTLAAGAPRVLLVPLEMGDGTVRCHKTPLLTSWLEVEALMAEIKTAVMQGNFPFKTIAFDTATALERMIHDYVLTTDPKWAKGNRAAITMESALGGYGKAYLLANEKFEQFLRWCDELAIYGKINIVITVHATPVKVLDPAHGEYETWDLLLHSPKSQGKYGKREILTQWADFVGFLHEPMFVVKAGEGERMNRAVSANQGRQIAVDRTPQWVAGNRYGLTGMIAIPPVNGWNNIAQAIHTATGIDVFNRDI